jgi:hypothetical protein
VVRGCKALGLGDLAQGSATYLAKLQHNRAESMWRREGAHPTDEVSGGLDTEAAGDHRRQSGWRSYCTTGLHLLNPSLVMNHLVQYEGIVNCRLGC